ncbi:MAG: hypothetical protein IT384_22020 [Deltaproteobacteria bacterium]|nr:hypothetical protein [Deltaproteobacteria bacterium]
MTPRPALSTRPALSARTAPLPAKLSELRQLAEVAARRSAATETGAKGAVEMTRFARGAGANFGLAAVGAVAAVAFGQWGTLTALLGGGGAALGGALVWLGMMAVSSGERAPGTAGTIRWLVPWWIVTAAQTALAFVLVGSGTAALVAGAGLLLSLWIAKGTTETVAPVQGLPRPLLDALARLPATIPASIESTLDAAVDAHRKIADVIAALPEEDRAAILDRGHLREGADLALTAALKQAARVVELERLASEQEEPEVLRALTQARSRLEEITRVFGDLRKSALTLLQGGGEAEVAEIRARADELAALAAVERELKSEAL